MLFFSRRSMHDLLVLWFLLVVPLVSGIYADQLGETDFLQQLIGDPTEGSLIVGDKLYIATTKGVLACLNQQSGSIVWRALVDDAPVEHMVLARNLIVALSQKGTKVSAWDTNTGSLVWEKMLPAGSNASSSIYDISFEPLSNSILVISNNSIYFLYLDGLLQAQFLPETSYSTANLKLTKHNSQSVRSGALHLVISHLVHPTESVQEGASSDRIIACGCFVVEETDQCSYAVLLSIIANDAVALSVYPVLPVSPHSVRANIQSSGPTDEYAMLYGIDDPRWPTFFALHISPSQPSTLISVPVPYSGAVDSVRSIALSTSATTASIASKLYAGVDICTSNDKSDCTAFVYFPRAEDSASSKDSLFKVSTCSSLQGGGSVIGHRRSLLHSSLAHSCACASVSENSLDIVTSALSSARVISTHTDSLQLSAMPQYSSFFASKTLSVGANHVSLLVASYGQVLIAAGSSVVAVREESLAHIRHALLVAPVTAKPHTSTIPSLPERLAEQQKVILKFLASAVEIAQSALPVLLSTSPVTVFRNLINGAYSSRRASDRDEIFGFNIQAMCVTEVRPGALKVVTLDMSQRRVVDALLPVLPAELEGHLETVLLLHGDQVDRELILLARTSKGQAAIWTFSHSSGSAGTRSVSPARVFTSSKLKTVGDLGKETPSGLRIYALIFDDHVATFPVLSIEETRSVLSSLYTHDAPSDANNGTLTTFSVNTTACETRDSMIACPYNEVASAVFPADEQIISVTYKTPGDAVLSRVSTLGDQSLLLKYLNPHAATVVSRTALEDSLVVTVVDTVSARILYRGVVPAGSEPVNVVMIENHVVVTYWNSKAVRPELSSIVLYEGMVGKNDLGPFSANTFSGEGPFSSFSTLAPIALQKTYIPPKLITTLHRTVTSKGLSNKNVLMGTASGQIVSLDMRVIHPRRPMGVPTQTEKEEQMQQYNPYIAFGLPAYVTNNASLAGLRRIVAAPSNLESTSLIFAYGLDVFFNHNKPSQSFDLLASDFNHSLLVIILTCLFGLVLLVRRMATRKQINSAWM